ncbi:RNA polymerase sigma factor SigM [mine drainage metagenome]|uniref:RNA polymerase sigma factor SigM n=1 Tax=mine drainage metagenome TaxID=410659 RepID=A0A1J5QAI0_9ZZZZ
MQLMAPPEQSHDWLAEHGDYLFRYALARLRDPHQAEDAVQETLLAALAGSGFAGLASPRTWLTGILKHKIIDQFRRQQREVSLDAPEQVEAIDPGMEEFFQDDGHWLEPPQAWSEPGNLLQQNQFLQVLQDCMDSLPGNLARIFLLREIEQSDNAEICQELEISPTNAWVMLYRARMGLRKCLEVHWLGES